MARIALIIQYDGSLYSGWQRQTQAISIQETLEEAIYELSAQKIKTYAAGRTDSGVHAAGQVLHFDIDFVIPDHKWSGALNGKLPQSIRVLESVGVQSNWHACHSAILRHYRYLIYNNKHPNLFINNWSWHRYQKYLDNSSMTKALEGMEGEHDFYAFQKSGSNRSSSITTIKDIRISRTNDLIAIDIKATGFLYGMVRSIVGQLVLVGEHKITPEIFYQRWSQKKKHEVLESAPAKGLCFVNAIYKQSVFKNFTNNDLFPRFNISGYS